MAPFYVRLVGVVHHITTQVWSWYDHLVQRYGIF